MGAVAGTNVVATEFCGLYKLVVVAFTPESASDTVTLTLASHGISVIKSILEVRLLTGQDADLQTIYATFSGLAITVKTQDNTGGNATDWTGATAEIVLIGY